MGVGAPLRRGGGPPTKGSALPQAKRFAPHLRALEHSPSLPCGVRVVLNPLGMGSSPPRDLLTPTINPCQEGTQTGWGSTGKGLRAPRGLEGSG